MNAAVQDLQPALAPPAPWLATERLQLREFTPDDRALVVRMHEDQRMRELLIDDLPLYRHEVCSEFLQRLQRVYRRHEGLGIWHAQQRQPALGDNPQLQALLSPEALRRLAQPRWQFAGWFNLMPMPACESEIELGSRLLPAAWGTGLAMEGGEALLRHAFETLQRPRVWAVCHPRHESVRYCVLALGFADEGVRPYEGEDARHYVVEREAWRQHMQAPRRERVRQALARVRAEAAR